MTMKEKGSIDFLVSLGGQGGVENVVNQTAIYLQNAGWKIRILQFADTNYRWTDPCLEWHSFWKDSKNIDFNATINMYVEFYRKNGAPDIVVAVTWPILTQIVKIVRLETGERYRIGSWLHASVANYEKYGLGGIDALRSADFHLAINHEISEEIRKGCLDASIYMVNNPVNMDVVAYAEERDERQFAFVGRLDELKHVDDVIRAFAEIPGEGVLHVVGDGSEKEYLVELSQKLGVGERVKFYGWQERPWEKVTKAGCLLFASEAVQEASPLVVIEALAAGMPVIATGVGETAYWIRNGENGWLFEKGNYHAMADIMRKVAEGRLLLPSARDCRNSVSDYLYDRPLKDVEEVFSIEVRRGKPINGEQRYPWISVIVSYRDNLAGLLECLRSVEAQTLDMGELQVILVDAGSTDGAQIAAHDFAMRYPEQTIELRLNGKGSHGEAKNMGMTYATGDYVMFLKPGMCLKADACEYMAALADKNGLDILQCDSSTDDAWTGNIHGSGARLNGKFDLSDPDMRKEFLTHELITCGTENKIFRRRFLLKAKSGFTEGLCHEDVKFVYPLLYLADAVGTSNRVISIRMPEEKVTDGEGRVIDYAMVRLQTLYDLECREDIFREYGDEILSNFFGEFYIGTILLATWEGKAISVYDYEWLRRTAADALRGREDNPRMNGGDLQILVKNLGHSFMGNRPGMEDYLKKIVSTFSERA